jgi:hypothetical protein
MLGKARDRRCGHTAVKILYAGKVGVVFLLN